MENRRAWLPLAIGAALITWMLAGTLAASPKDTAAEPGYLSINCAPWAEVRIDGEKVGNTPVMRLKVDPGVHRVVLINRDSGARRAFGVLVESGKHKRIVKRLAPDR